MTTVVLAADFDTTGQSESISFSSNLVGPVKKKDPYLHGLSTAAITVTVDFV